MATPLATWLWTAHGYTFVVMCWMDSTWLHQSQGSGSSCKPSLHAWALANNPWLCVLSQDVAGPPTRKAQVSIFTVHKPLVLRQSCTDPTQGRYCSVVGEGMPWPEVGGHAVMLLANVTCPRAIRWILPLLFNLRKLRLADICCDHVRTVWSWSC